MTRGFEDSGALRPVFAVEFDRDAAATYAANFGDHVACGRIEDVAAFPRADVVIGGPPCQGFSPLNREAVGFERRGLWTRVPAGAGSGRAAGVRDGERPRAAALRRVRGVPGARRSAGLHRRGRDPQRRRLRRPPAPPARDRDRHPLERRTPWPSTTPTHHRAFCNPEGDKLRASAREPSRLRLATFRRRSRGCRSPGRARLAPAAETAAGVGAALQGGAARRRRSLRHAAEPRPGRARRPRAALLARTSRPAPPTSSAASGGTAPR